MSAFEVSRYHDEWGPIHVLSDNDNIYLTFGNGGEQSGMQVNQPDRLLFQYTQCMMLALLLAPDARGATLLGLGAGSLAKALLLADENLQVTVVELREKVALAARDWFSLPDSKRLTLHIGDAFEHIQAPLLPAGQQDLLFVDLYLDNGLQDQLVDPAFLQASYDHLKDEGVLVINLWDEGKGILPLCMDTLQEVFGSQPLQASTQEGNVIVFVGKDIQLDPHPRRLQAQAKKLGGHLDVPLQRLLNRLQVVV
ncbi:spermidine synthase [Aliamphritea hakodatensis]|uniref:spermidine synthase n=1 Tax=Aliamphritea hakodatensis TaxID=2895352 RepID=UPI0022FD996E|nr:hypothetical protein [Aliamphritea hakodatensis]